MKETFAPVLRQGLADRLARRIRGMIQKGDYHEGDRLPTIMEMAKSFGVGHPTIREALKKLETMGMVEIRHGSGVFVSRREEFLVLASPDYGGTVTRKLLVDLIRARIPLEIQSVSDATINATPEHLAEMRRLLNEAGQIENNDQKLNEVNMAFHRQIAVASGNTVLAQLLEVLQELFNAEQRFILGIHSRQQDHMEHLSILDALDKRDQQLGIERMRMHLEGVQEALLRWDPEHHPVNGA